MVNSPQATIERPQTAIRLSQGQLNLLATCPRKFQHTYLEQLGVPTTPEQLERLTSGSQFHLLMQQWQLGLPIEPFVQEDVQLQKWFNSFIQASPQILMLDREGGETLQQSEYALTIAFEGYLLTVIYDLLITNQVHAKILDWKTYPRPQNSRWLMQNWQTRLYPFVLAESGSYTPEQISMTYWFFQTGSGSTGEPQSLTIAYDTAKHEQTRQDLITLLNQLTHWLERYQLGEPFPQIPLSANQCEPCNFAVRCDRATSHNENQREGWDESSLYSQTNYSLLINPEDLILPNLADIDEVPL